MWVMPIREHLLVFNIKREIVMNSLNYLVALLKISDKPQVIYQIIVSQMEPIKKSKLDFYIQYLVFLLVSVESHIPVYSNKYYFLLNIFIAALLLSKLILYYNLFSSTKIHFTIVDQ